MKFFYFARELARITLRLNFKIIATNKHNVPDRRGYILASNHLSNIDPVVVSFNVKYALQYMAKKELFEKPYGFIFHWIGAFPVDRGSGDTQVLDKAAEIIKNDSILGLFPEGSRSKDGNIKRAKSGIVVIANAAKCDILPASIEYGEKKFFFRKVYITYGEMIKFDEIAVIDNDKQQIKDARNLITQRIIDCREQGRAVQKEREENKKSK